MYNPPFVKTENKPQVYNAEIETHIKSIFKSNFVKGDKFNTMQKGGSHHKVLNSIYEARKQENSHFHGTFKK